MLCKTLPSSCLVENFQDHILTPSLPMKDFKTIHDIKVSKLLSESTFLDKIKRKHYISYDLILSIKTWSILLSLAVADFSD